jgi:hypothetical protein
MHLLLLLLVVLLLLLVPERGTPRTSGAIQWSEHAAA